MAPRVWRSALVATLSVVALTAAHAQSVRTRSVGLAVVDKSGAAITDLAKEDFSVKEGGTARDVLVVRTLPTKFRLAIIDSDGGAGMYQLAIATLIQRVLKDADQEAEVSIISVVEQPEVALNYEVDPQKIVAGIGRVGVRAGGKRRPGQLMDAFTAAMKTIAKPGYRPVIVAFRVGGESPSADRAQNLRDAMQKTGTALFVVSSPGASNGGGGAGGAGGGSGNMAEASGQLADATMADAATQLQLVINDGSKESGGRFITANATSAVKAMELLAGELLNTYEVTYTLPEGTSTSDSVQIAVARKDAKVASQSKVR